MSAANGFIILDNVQVQVFILYKTRRKMECSDQQCNEVMISMICKSKVKLQLIQQELVPLLE